MFTQKRQWSPALVDLRYWLGWDMDLETDENFIYV